MAFVKLMGKSRKFAVVPTSPGAWGLLFRGQVCGEFLVLSSLSLPIFLVLPFPTAAITRGRVLKGEERS